MFKIISAVVMLVCALPALANAASWLFNTQAKSSGGTITSRNMVNQTSTSGSLFKSYTTHAPLSVTVAANTGYDISNVTVNGVITNAPASPYSTTVQGMTQQTVFATFAATQLSVTATAGPGGTVSPASISNIYYGTILTNARVFTFRPQSGFRLNTLTGTGGASVSSALPAAINAAVTVTFPAGYTFTTPIAISGTFGSSNPVATGGAPQTVLVGSLVTLTGSYSGGSGTPPAYYNWTQISGPSVTLASNGNQATFTAHSLGTYLFKVTLDTGSSTTTVVTVTTSAATAAQEQCQGCHTSAGVGTAANVFNKWASSRHEANLVMCAKCHIGADTGAHPGPPLAILYQICGTCHFDSSGNVPSHLFEIGVNTCVTCHDPHSTVGSITTAQAAHYNNITSGKYPASYVTSRAVCSNCHFNTVTNGINRHEWATSGHSATTIPAWTAYDFKTMTGCVQCHTTTGFIAYSSGKVTTAWGDASDKTKEVLRCNGCHSDISNGTVRTFTPVSPYVDDTYTNPDVGKSNVCLTCHSGRKNGSSITARIGADAAFANMTIIDPHYMAAGGTMYGVAGYHFPGRSYTADITPSHRNINSADMNNTLRGPCITCHKNEFFSHTFRPSWSGNPLCSSCHVTMSDAQLAGAKTALANALEVLRAQLAAKGFVYSPTYPYFSFTNWGLGEEGANTMGAAFNYILLLREPGAFAHNPSYAKQLVLDSIDYLDNGVIDDSVAYIALPGLVSSGAISQAVANSFSSYKAMNLCTTCHGGTAATASPMSTNAHPAHLTGAYGPGAYLGTNLSACQTCHVYNASKHMNGVVDVLNGADPACGSCHSGNVPNWWGGVRLACTSCHSANPAVLPNGTAAPYKGNFVTAGHGQFTASNQCTMCHDPDSSHISGSLGSFTRLRLSNDNGLCASCHNNASVVGAAFRNMSTHVAIDGRALSCRDCHDPHGTSNLGMIREVINGSTITFTDKVNGLVDLVTNRGLCQVCHTQTNHYRAGMLETNHFTSGCLNCHRHNSSGGAFRPSGGSCDSCHGYPPAPRVVTYAVSFGVQGNWSSARFENYSGGGGAHLVAGHIAKDAKPSDGWANCSSCHSGGAASHAMTLPMRDHVENVTVSVDPKYRFSDDAFVVYTSAKFVSGGANQTGGCSNVACHLKPAPRWSLER